MDDEIKYMKTHPPRCIENKFSTPSISLINSLQGQLGENTTCFSPLCECGNNIFKLAKPVGFGITSITCNDCNITRILFDPKKYGFDGELGHNEEYEMDPSEEYFCSKCGNITGEIAAGFQYAGETDILEEEDAPEIKPEDLFGWFMISAKCDKCGNIEIATQSECA